MLNIKYNNYYQSNTRDFHSSNFYRTNDIQSTRTITQIATDCSGTENDSLCHFSIKFFSWSRRLDIQEGERTLGTWFKSCDFQHIFWRKSFPFQLQKKIVLHSKYTCRSLATFATFESTVHFISIRCISFN